MRISVLVEGYKVVSDVYTTKRSGWTHIVGEDLICKKFSLRSNTLPEFSLAANNSSDMSAVAAVIDRVIIGSSGLEWPVSISNEIVATSHLEAFTKTTTELDCRCKCVSSTAQLIGKTYGLVGVVDASVNNANLDTLAEDALLVQLAHTSSDVGGIVVGRGIVTVAMDVNGRERDLLIQPDLDNVG